MWRIVNRLGMNLLAASQRYTRHQPCWKRYAKQRPGHDVQIDVKFIEPITAGPTRRTPVHRYRRMHPAAGAADLPALGPEDRDPVPGICVLTAAPPDQEDPNRHSNLVLATGDSSGEAGLRDSGVPAHACHRCLTEWGSRLLPVDRGASGAIVGWRVRLGAR